jgi:hypothetical protein
MLTYASNASKQHIAMGEFLVANGYKDFGLEQEVAVKTICPDYSNGRDRFDYVVKDLSIVIELHGQQHYKPVTFGGVSKQIAKHNFVRQVNKDVRKAEAAIAAGYYYISYSYKEAIDLDSFTSKLKEAMDVTSTWVNKPVAEEQLLELVNPPIEPEPELEDSEPYVLTEKEKRKQEREQKYLDKQKLYKQEAKAKQKEWQDAYKKKQAELKNKKKKESSDIELN